VIHRLHAKYGTVVRIGPAELSFADIESVNEIYSQQTPFMKAPVYDSMTVKPLGIFSLQDKKAAEEYSATHSRRACVPLIQQHVQRLVVVVDQASGEAVDVFLLFRLCA
jgi:hypothetical protein